MRVRVLNYRSQHLNNSRTYYQLVEVSAMNTEIRSDSSESELRTHGTGSRRKHYDRRLVGELYHFEPPEALSGVEAVFT